MTEVPFPSNDDLFQVLRDDVAGRVDLSARFPSWPFRATSGYAVIFEYDRILGGSFGKVLSALSGTYGDDFVTVVGIEPGLAYYRDEYCLYPAFRVPGERIRVAYGEALRFEPGGDPTGALGDSLNVIAITGSSGMWSVFGQRDWEIGLLLARDSDGTWLSTGIPWYATNVDLDSIRSPAGWGVPLGNVDRGQFARQCLEHGNGP